MIDGLLELRIDEFMSYTLCGHLRSNKDSQEFIRFLQNIFHARRSYYVRFCEQLQPEYCFIDFFNDDAKLGEELGFGSSSANSPIISSYRGSGAKQLFA